MFSELVGSCKGTEIGSCHSDCHVRLKAGVLEGMGTGKIPFRACWGHTRDLESLRLHQIARSVCVSGIDRLEAEILGGDWDWHDCFPSFA